MSTSAEQPLDRDFTATIQKSLKPGGWSYVQMAGSADFFHTRGRVKVTGTVDGQPFTSAFLALGDGTHKLPLAAELRRALGKGEGDTVDVHLSRRLS
jgi:hypothetical protein